MPIPSAKRVVFTPNPLVEVVTQLTFPRLLELEDVLPVKFQKAIQSSFPILEATKVLEFAVNPERPEATKASEVRRYVFLSRDKKWQCVLSGNSIALTTSDYVNWVGFKERLNVVLSAFFQSYEPALFSRIGLRYRDAISRSRLGLENTPWRQLLASHIAGLLATDAVNESDVTGCRTSAVFKITDEIKVQLNHGLVEGANQESEYMIDSDFFVDQTIEASFDAAISTLSSFRPYTNDLFQWCISEQLFNAMDPQPVPATG